MQREKRRLLDILPEVKTALATSIKGWDGILKGAKNKLKKDLTAGKKFPQGVQAIDISKTVSYTHLTLPTNREV